MKGKINPPNEKMKIPKNSQWLGGIGSGSWFFIERQKSDYRIKRFSEEGYLECVGLFRVKRTGFDVEKPYRVTYLSHCRLCTIIQNKIEYKLELIRHED